MGHDLTVYSRGGEKKFSLFSRANASKVTKASQKMSLLADDTLTIEATSARPLDITIGDYIMVFGKRYTFNQLPQPTKTGDHVFSYTMTLEGLQYELIDVHYHLPADAYGENYYANLQKHLEILAWNINRIHPGWTVEVDADAYSVDDYKNVSASEKNALAMLQELCELFSVEFEVTPQGTGGKIQVRKKAGTTQPFTLHYGRGLGLYKLGRANVNNSGIVNRLYVYGSSENLPQNYGSTKLCLADTSRLSSYLEDADSIAAYGVREGEKNYSDIKAERVGEVTALGTDKITFFDTSGDEEDPAHLPMFDLNAKDDKGNTKYLVKDTTAKIKFQTGNLAGYEFDLHSYDHATKKFIINKFKDENGLEIPNDTQTAFNFAVGDKYIITDIKLPDSYVTQAQAKLEEKARKDFAPMTQPQVSYKLTLDQQFFNKLWGTAAPVEVLHVGDFVHIIDPDIGVDKEVRITGITRDLLKTHTYDVTLSDTVVKSSIVKTFNDINDLQEAIGYNSGFSDPAKARRRWMATLELLNMVFDPEGDYYSEKIKPLSIETQMLSVGAKSTQFALQNTTIQPNYNGDPNAINFSGGVLVHYGLDPDTPKTWVMAASTYGALGSAFPFYIYARCPKDGSNGTFVLDTAPRKCEGEAAYYYFLVGVLNSVSNDSHGGNPARLISLTYGSSTINGRFVRCGRIESSGGGATFFDLDTGIISGTIKFRSTDGTVKDVSDIESKADELEDYINNTLPGVLGGMSTQIDGKVETWYCTDDPSTAWTTDDERAKHVGDLWFNTGTHEAKRYNTSYAWELIQDADAIAALEAAANAQDTADGKRRVFTAQPYPPYDVGDLWTNGIDLRRCITARQTGSYVAADWDLATNYTSDAALNDFITNTYNAAITEITNQLDGVVETFFGNGAPTLLNEPAVNWTTDTLREKHLCDMYYDNDSGIGYRFSKTTDTTGTAYVWVEIRDSGVTQALAAAAAAQDTADGKRRVFTAQPVPPYDKGDLWVTGTDLKVCITAKGEGASYAAADWDLATNYTSDENLNNFIDGVFEDTISEIYDQIDGKVESWYTSTDPAAAWTTDEERRKHVGDQWYNITSNRLYFYKRATDGTYSWVEIKNQAAIDAAAAAASAQDTADGKRRVFTSTPYPPYDVGDLWTQGTAGDLMRCKTARATGSYQASDWEKATKYTDDTALVNFINGTYAGDISDLTSQIDGKIECWYTTSDPRTGWSSGDYEKHLGDQWYNTSTKVLARFCRYVHTFVALNQTPAAPSGAINPYWDSSALTYWYWSKIENADAIAAAAAAAAAQDTADGKRTVFTAEPKAPYYVGDLWLKNIDSTGKAAGGLWRCITANTTAGSFNSAHWVEATYYDCTQTTIDGGIVTAGTVQLAGAKTSSIVAGITGGQGKTFKETTSTPEAEKVRIWAGASEGNRKTAPFRVLQNGKVIASDAEIAGTVTSQAGEIGGWKLHEGRLTSSDKDATGATITPAVELNAEKGQIIAAGNVYMDADGFNLIRDGYSMVKVANVSVGEYNDNMLRKNYDRTSSGDQHSQPGISVYVPYSGNSYSTASPMETVTIPLGFFEKGSTIHLQGVSFRFTVPSHKTNGSASVNVSTGYAFSVKLMRGTTVVKSWNSGGFNASRGNTVAVSINPKETVVITSGQEGSYSLVVEKGSQWYWTAGSSGSLSNFTIITTVFYKFTRGNFQRTLLGYDGLVSTWQGGYMFMNGSAFVVKFGNYALKIDSSGVKKSTNGGATYTDV